MDTAIEKESTEKPYINTLNFDENGWCDYCDQEALCEYHFR